VFPFIGLYPVLTIALSIIFLNEKAGTKQWLGIAIALLAGLFIAYKEPGESAAQGSLWLILSIGVFVLWAVQSFIMKYSNITMKAESIFFYMMLGAVLLIPIAWFMTDFSQEINWSFKGPYLAALIHVLNSIGALTLVYALRYGKAIVIVPMVGVSPRLITIVVSLAIYSVLPGPVLSIGLVLAIIAIILMMESKKEK
jgi:drug/metabolite transporter (DMT)-like permease